MATMERSQFTFYASFYSAICRIRDRDARLDAFDVICRYALTGEAPDLEALPETAAMAFDLVRPVLDSGRRKAESGRKGGSEGKPEANLSKFKQIQANLSKPEARDNRKQTEAIESKPKQSEAKPKLGETASKKEGEKEKEVEVEREVEKEIENKSSPERVPPTLQEVTAYVAARGNKIDAARFYQFYSRSNFRTRTGPLDWQAKVVEWERTERSRPARQVTAAAYNARPPEAMTMDTFDALADKI